MKEASDPGEHAGRSGSAPIGPRDRTDPRGMRIQRLVLWIGLSLLLVLGLVIATLILAGIIAP